MITKMESKILSFYDALSEKKGFVQLLVRITLGWVFVESGWGKLHNIPHVIEFFTSLGIPFASIQAPFIASLEFFGGICIVFGLITRPMSVLLSGTMAVAILTAKRHDIESFSDLAGMSEFLYLLLFLSLIFVGPGRISLDFLYVSIFRRKLPRSP